MPLILLLHAPSIRGVFFTAEARHHMGKVNKPKIQPHYRIPTWPPKLVGDFLVAHEFKLVGLDGDDYLWRGKGPDGKDAQVAFPKMRAELSPGTMRCSVMKHSGYSKEHWDLWRSLRRSYRKRRRCCIPLH